jgi:hypothetical protein
MILVAPIVPPGHRVLSPSIAFANAALIGPSSAKPASGFRVIVKSGFIP